MSKPVFEDLFTFSNGRRNRKSYLLADLSIFAATIVLGAMIGWVVAMGEFTSAIVIFTVACIMLFVMLIVAGFAIVTQRCRDVGISGWWTMVFLPANVCVFPLEVMYGGDIDVMTPFAGFLLAGMVLWSILALVFRLFLLFKRGAAGHNKYGEDPLVVTKE